MAGDTSALDDRFTHHRRSVRRRGIGSGDGEPDPPAELLDLIDLGSDVDVVALGLAKTVDPA